jgi:hypothetical protein
MVTKKKSRTAIGYGTKPWPTGGGHSLEHKLSWHKMSTCNPMGKKSCADHGKDSSPPPFVQSVKPGGSWNLIATARSGGGDDELTGGPRF